MVGLDISPIAPEIARLLLLRGASLPPVLWKDEPNRGAKRILDEMDDATLLGVTSLADESMGAAVRALLYMWTGWLGECQMFSGAAPKLENSYLSALCERHAGRFTQAKEHFKSFETHPVYEPLTAYALAVTANLAEPALQRIREMLQQDQRWEPHLFCDAVALASINRIKSAAETIVRQIVCREFELLFVHCYEAAIGQKLSQRTRPSESASHQNAQIRERRIREERRKRDEERKRQEFLSQMSQTGKTSSSGSASPPPAKPAAPAKVEMVGVLCPKCGHARQVSVAFRGKATQCPKCSTNYLVPKEAATVATRS